MWKYSSGKKERLIIHVNTLAPTESVAYGLKQFEGIIISGFILELLTMSTLWRAQCYRLFSYPIEFSHELINQSVDNFDKVLTFICLAAWYSSLVSNPSRLTLLV